MKTILKLKYSFGIVLLSLMISCNDNFLEEEMFSQLGPANFYKTEKDAMSALNGVYDGLQSKDYYANNVWHMSDFSTEIVVGFWKDPFDRYTYENDEANKIYPLWKKAWVVNNRANSVIDRVSAMDLNEEIKNRIIGEAKFIRGLNYFNLVRYFGHIPLITKETTSIDENQFNSQVTRDEVYNQIIEDLQFAETYLPIVQEEVGRATSGAAKAILGKVYLTRSGKYLNHETGILETGDPMYYQLAADKLKEVIDGNAYSLEANFEDVFSPDNENGKEIIFAIQYLAGAGAGENEGEGNSFGPKWVPKGAGISLAEFKSGGVPIEFYNSYESSDTRRDASFMTSYIDRNGATISYPQSPLTVPHVRKFLSDIQEGPDPNFSAVDEWDYGMNFPVIRYADVLLMYSEALNEVGDGNALWGINEVRTRAGLTVLSNVGQTTLRNKILQERKWELCVEGHGWFDYTRLGVLLELENSLGHKSGYQYPTARNYLYPIPFKAMEINKNLNQNFGY